MYKDLANSTYESIFYDGYHPLSSDVESLKSIILNNRELIRDRLQKKLFINELILLIKQNKIDIAIEQQWRFGMILISNYSDVKALYEWLHIINSDEIVPDKKKSLQLNTFKWIVLDSQLEDLYKELVPNFVSPNTSLKVFKSIFSGAMLNEHQAKVTWVKVGKNHDPNKKSISDFVNILAKQELIDNSFQGNQKVNLNMLTACFSTLKGDTVFNRANLTKEENTSDHYLDLEKIIKSIISLPE